MIATAMMQREVLQKATEQGISLKKRNDIRKEKDARTLFYLSADKKYKEEIQKNISEITKTAKAGNEVYFIPILQNSTEEGYWKHIVILNDGKLYIDGVFDIQYPNAHNICRVFEPGVLHRKDEVRNFDEYESKKVLAWMVARKLAITFIQRHLEVAVLRAYIHITREYQKQIDYKSSKVEMYFLRLTWG